MGLLLRISFEFFQHILMELRMMRPLEWFVRMESRFQLILGQERL